MSRFRSALLSAPAAACLLAGLSLSGMSGAAQADRPAAPPAPVAVAATPPADTAGDPARYVSFVQEDDTDCLLRDGKHVLVRNLHPTRTVRVWLDRFYRNVGTGDRSRSDLKPGAEGEALGCSRIDNADQEWRIVRAVFLD